MIAFQLYISAVLIALFSSLAALSTWRTARKATDGTGFWLLGFILYLLSILAIRTAGCISYPWQQILTNSLECLGSYFQLAGFVRFYKVRNRSLKIALIAAGFIINTSGALCELLGIPHVYAICESLNNLLPSAVLLCLVISRHRVTRYYSIYIIITYIFITLIQGLLAGIQLCYLFKIYPDIAMFHLGSFSTIYWLIQLPVLVFSQNHTANSFLNKKFNESIESLLRYKERIQAINRELCLANQDIISIFSDALDSRLSETSDHLYRVSEFTRIILDTMHYQGDDRELIIHGAALHDIGKIGMSDRILQSSGAFSLEEKRTMEQHTTTGYEILAKSGTKLLKTAAIIALEHHENWDGSGYPSGKKGRAISFEARVVAVADVFDALISQRPYKRAWSNAEARDFMLENSGLKFDPEIVKVIPRCMYYFEMVLTGEKTARERAAIRN